MKLILVTFVFLLFSNSLTSEDITKIRFIYGQEGALIPIAASCDISFIAQFGEDLNILTTYDDTLYMGEYFGIIKNGNRMQDNDSLLNLVKTKIG